jgi:hypothetical protein
MMVYTAYKVKVLVLYENSKITKMTFMKDLVADD